MKRKTLFDQINKQMFDIVSIFKDRYRTVSKFDVEPVTRAKKLFSWYLFFCDPRLARKKNNIRLRKETSPRKQQQSRDISRKNMISLFFSKRGVEAIFWETALLQKKGVRRLILRFSQETASKKIHHVMSWWLREQTTNFGGLSRNIFIRWVVLFFFIRWKVEPGSMIWRRFNLAVFCRANQNTIFNSKKKNALG